MKWKVCGLKHPKNIEEVASLKPDYMGFIFYDMSPRNFEGIIPDIPKGIEKVGVFVNEFIEILVSLAQEYKLGVVQLHGDENVDYIKEIKSHLPKIKIIKVVSVKESIDFESLNDFEEVVDYFLFDTSGKNRGGNGVKFNWGLLEKYPLKTPYFLSGGISNKDIDEIKKHKSIHFFGVDVNSGFEIHPGLKDVKLLKTFKSQITRF